MQLSTKRTFWVDAVRVTAMLLVLLNHSLEHVFALNTAEEWMSYTPPMRYFSTFVFGIGRLGVPLFLFLTGYLILSKKMDSYEEIIHFYKHNLLSMVITMEIWIIIMSFYLRMINPTYSLKQILLTMIFWKQVDSMQMWYAPFIVGTYLGLPFLKCIVSHIPNKIIGIYLGVLTILDLCFPIMHIFYTFNEPDLLKNVLWGSGYNSYVILYLIAGYFLGNNYINLISKIPIYFWIATGVILFVINWYTQCLAYSCGHDAKFGYQSITAFLSSICLFVILKKIFEQISISEVLEKVINRLSQVSFGAFFLHTIVQDMLLKVSFICVKSHVIQVFLLWIVSVAITYTICLFIKKNSAAGKLLLNIK